jgi:hypothetical protein
MAPEDIYGKLLAAAAPEAADIDGTTESLLAIDKAANKLSALVQTLIEAHSNAVQERHNKIRMEWELKQQSKNQAGKDHGLPI